MIIRNGYIAWVLLMGAVALASCHKQEPVTGGVPIALQVGMGETKAATAGTTTTSLQSEGLGLFAWYTEAGGYFDGANKYLENTQFSYSAGGFHATPAAYWLPGCRLSFFSYAPYQANVSSGSLVFPSGYENGFPLVSYTPSANPAQQVDLCLSAPMLDRSLSDGVVPLSFTHALTKVLFKARWTGDANTEARMADRGYTVRITEMTLSHIRGTNTVHYSREGYHWEIPATSELEALATASYALSSTSGTLVDLDHVNAPIPKDSWNEAFVLQSGILYLLPQALAPSACLSVTFGFYKSGGSLAETFTAEFAIGQLQQYEWPMGKVITYSLTLDLTPGGYPTITGTLSGNIAGGYQEDDGVGDGLSHPGAYYNGPNLPDV